MYAHAALRSVPVVNRIATLEEHLTPSQLALVAADIAGHRPIWQALVRHDPNQRWFERLLLTGSIEAWLIGWTPGQGTPAHDHAGSAGAFAVTEGVLTEEVFTDTSLSSVRELVHGPGMTLELTPTHIHRVSNQGVVNATSIHVYSPPDRPMRIYGPARRPIAGMLSG